METAIIKKRLNTFKGAKGILRDVSDEVVMAVLRGWESWSGNTAEYYREIGLSKMQMVTMIQKAKRLVKSGKVMESEFQEIALPMSSQGTLSTESAMELKLDVNRAIRFSQVDHLVEFLKKTS